MQAVIGQETTLVVRERHRASYWAGSQEMMLELLSYLEPKTQDIRGLPPGFGKLNQADIAHALSYVHGRGPRLLGRVKYALQDEFLAPLEYQLTKSLKHRARVEYWRAIGPLPSCSKLAVKLYARPDRCQKCDGVGERLWGARIIICPRCTNSKWEPVTNASMSRFIGVDRANFERVWKSRLGVAMAVLGGWDNRCVGGLRKALDKPQQNR